MKVSQTGVYKRYVVPTYLGLLSQSKQITEYYKAAKFSLDRTA